jgi:hypothetical protein
VRSPGNRSESEEVPRRTGTRRTGPSFGFFGALVGICVLAVGGAALVGRRGGDPEPGSAVVQAATTGAAPVVVTTVPTVAPTVAPTVPPPTAPPDPGTLPQTEDRPTTTSPGFQARMRALWQGITTDDADAALPAFFPITAYRQVKAISNPDGDFNSRLIPAYREDVRTLFGRLGAQAAGAQLLGVDVPENATWVPPGDEYNKGSYWRVYGATLRWSTPDGRTGTFPITAMISWRGEWYVVHLGPIR